MVDKIHILGNGPSWEFFKPYQEERDGRLLICNVPPMECDRVYACCIVDFKMMKNLMNGTINLDRYKWVLGNRPKIWMDKKPSWFIQHSHHIREFYTDVPKYCGKDPAQAATNFNCGHFATHYAARQHKPKEIHLWGFDSIMDHTMKSSTDDVLPSDRNRVNNFKLLEVWRPIWTNIFKEFEGKTNFVIHHSHSSIKTKAGVNVGFVNHS